LVNSHNRALDIGFRGSPAAGVPSLCVPLRNRSHRQLDGWGSARGGALAGV